MGDRLHPVRLAGNQVVLREFQRGDLDAVTAIVGDDRVTHWLSFDTRSPDEAATMLDGIIERTEHEPRQEYYLATTRPPADDVIGFCRLALSGVQAAKLGFAVHADHWGQGLASDAAATMIDFGFNSLDLHRVSAAIGPTNEASIAVAEKLGLTYEGRLRDHAFTNGQWRDSLLFSILTHEWRNSKPREGQGHQAPKGDAQRAV
jgi:[ribosomal protein S5]-alanine N-acetyltransferase